MCNWEIFITISLFLFSANSALSRGKALLLRSSSTAAVSPSSTCGDPVLFAQTWNIPVVDVEDIIKMLKIERKLLKAIFPKTSTKTAPESMLKELVGNFLKVEDKSQHYVPIFKIFNKYPSLAVIENIRENREDSKDEKKDFVHKSKPKLKCLLEVKKKSVKKLEKKKGGYCECCEEVYCNLKAHVKSDKHVMFSQKSENFSGLDSMISELPSMRDLMCPEVAHPTTSALSLVSDKKVNKCETMELSEDMPHLSKFDDDDKFVNMENSCSGNVVSNKKRKDKSGKNTIDLKVGKTKIASKSSNSLGCTSGYETLDRYDLSKITSRGTVPIARENNLKLNKSVNSTKRKSSTSVNQLSKMSEKSSPHFDQIRHLSVVLVDCQKMKSSSPSGHSTSPLLFSVSPSISNLAAGRTSMATWVLVVLRKSGLCQSCSSNSCFWLSSMASLGSCSPVASASPSMAFLASGCPPMANLDSGSPVTNQTSSSPSVVNLAYASPTVAKLGSPSPCMANQAPTSLSVVNLASTSLAVISTRPVSILHSTSPTVATGTVPIARENNLKLDKSVNSTKRKSSTSVNQLSKMSEKSSPHVDQIRQLSVVLVDCQKMKSSSPSGHSTSPLLFSVSPSISNLAAGRTSMANLGSGSPKENQASASPAQATLVSGCLPMASLGSCSPVASASPSMAFLASGCPPIANLDSGSPVANQLLPVILW